MPREEVSTDAARGVTYKGDKLLDFYKLAEIHFDAVHSFGDGQPLPKKVPIGLFDSMDGVGRGAGLSQTDEIQTRDAIGGMDHHVRWNILCRTAKRAQDSPSAYAAKLV